MSNYRLQERQNSGDNVFSGLRVGQAEPSLFARFLDAHDFAANSRRAMSQDVRKFARWFAEWESQPLWVSNRVGVKNRP
jgi:hypothetical protein